MGGQSLSLTGSPTQRTHRFYFVSHLSIVENNDCIFLLSTLGQPHSHPWRWRERDPFLVVALVSPRRRCSPRKTMPKRVSQRIPRCSRRSISTTSTYCCVVVVSLSMKCLHSVLLHGRVLHYQKNHSRYSHTHTHPRPIRMLTNSQISCSYLSKSLVQIAVTSNVLGKTCCSMDIVHWYMWRLLSARHSANNELF